MNGRNWAALLVLSALWGGSFLFMRVAAPALGPFLLVELRVLLAGLALLGYGFLSGKVPVFRTHWRQFLIIGVVNSALPFLLIATASLHLTASLTATLNATTPLFGAVIASFWLSEKLTSRKLRGLLLGLLGVAVLVGFGPLPLTRVVLVSVAASLFAAFSYGVGAVYVKRRAEGASPMALATYSQLSAAVVILPTVPFALPAQGPTAEVVLSVVALALLSTALAYLLYFHLIVHAGPTNAMLVTYLAPAFGILWGALLLAEPLSVGMFVGFGLILTSVSLVARSPATRQKASGVA